MTNSVEDKIKQVISDAANVLKSKGEHEVADGLQRELNKIIEIVDEEFSYLNALIEEECNNAFISGYNAALDDTGQ